MSLLLWLSLMHSKDFKLITLFLFGLILVFTLIFTRNYFKLLPISASTGGNFVVFDDQLSSNFSNWSWNSSINFNNSSPVYSGNKSIAFSPSAWGGFYLHASTPINVSQYSSLQFAIQTTDKINNFTLYFYDANNKQLTTSYPISQFAGSSENGWTFYSIPLTQIPSDINGFAIQETSGDAGPVTYLDAIQFIANQLISPTDSTSQAFTIYSDSLASNWVNWSWNSTINFIDNTNPYFGSYDISFTPTSGYGGLYLHTNAGIKTSTYQTLTFVAKAGGNNESFAVGLYGVNNQLLTSPVSLNNFGGQPTTNSWKVYTVPLSALNAANQNINGLVIQDTTGHPQPALYLDQIALTSTQTSMTSANNPTATPIPNTNSQNMPINTQLLTGNSLSGLPFFDELNGDPALEQEEEWHSSNPTDATLIAKIATQPKAIWVGDWTSNVQTYVQNEMNNALKANAIPVFVSYNIPERDCGGYSSGGATSPNAYKSWINAFAAGIGSGRAVIILEPDALSQISCLSSTDQQSRLSLLSYAIQKLKSLGKTAVYIDAGHYGWIDPTTMATSLKNADVTQADGFSLNLSNFNTNSDSIFYGQQISALIGNKHFVIDTSRNGKGPTPDNQWCNPPGMALGNKPTTQTGYTLVDAYLWIKYPGESDGTCNGGPAAGIWDPSYALGLAQNSSW